MRAQSVPEPRVQWLGELQLRVFRGVSELPEFRARVGVLAEWRPLLPVLLERARKVALRPQLRPEEEHPGRVESRWRLAYPGMVGELQPGPQEQEPLVSEQRALLAHGRRALQVVSAALKAVNQTSEEAYQSAPEAVWEVDSTHLPSVAECRAQRRLPCLDGLR